MSTGLCTLIVVTEYLQINLDNFVYEEKQYKYVLITLI